MKSSSSKTFTFVVITAIVSAVFYFLAGGKAKDIPFPDLSGLPGMKERDTIARIADSVPPAPPREIEVYFSHTYANKPDIARSYGENIDRQLARFIGAATSTLDCAFFELESQRIADALIAAHLRGVKVRVVGDTDYEMNPEMQAVIDAGIPVIFDQRSALMHNKFVVADNASVWTGSFNATDNCAFKNNNNAVVIRDRRIADNYHVEFAEMFENGEFGPRSSPSTPHSLIKAGGADIYTYFAPEDDVPPKIIRILRSAKKSIRFMAFSFTDADIANVLMEQAGAGVDVEGVVERRGMESKGAQAPRLQRSGVRVLPDGNSFAMHHKVFIVDGMWTITGSYNFTASGAQSNDENLVIIKSEGVARKFSEEYERVRRMAGEAS